MRHHEMITETIKRRKFTHNTCDVCQSKYDDNIGLGARISSKKEHDDGDYSCYDICDDCFNGKLLPFLTSLGAVPHDD